METATLPNTQEAQDFMPINGTDYVELYVGNSKQAAHFYKTAFGFQSYAYAGLVNDLASFRSILLYLYLVLELS